MADAQGLEVEELVQRLLQQAAAEGDTPDASPDAPTPIYEHLSKEAFRNLLSPETQALQDQLGRPAPPMDLDEDTRAWIREAAKKHA
jgi:hypothetical protein